ncbi:aberrant zinc-finger domain-containing microsporidia-specific protein [Hamiltosporidium tvaerminnensis]|uniref:Aberrant zinc-finger domain-containing microsporidia-specific protein n=1 Tax=Hamiltosporidium tvaerminnensis TaxID=1176355 RepID=A0A4Q9LDG1_9MICR|nr:aberrant zinc-finger domain-containing microsporidia-specific protein [Hamiltosporidium tvaerminnensis]
MDIKGQKKQQFKTKKKAPLQTDLFYKCFFNDCILKYSTVHGLKKHLKSYNHLSYLANINKTIKCPFRDCNATGEITSHAEKYHSAFFEVIKEYLQYLSKINISYIRKENTSNITTTKKNVSFHDICKVDLIINEIFSSVFCNGILKINDSENTKSTFYCSIPGCGKIFQSHIAYKYHTKTQVHFLSYIIAHYERKKDICLDHNHLIGIFKKYFKIVDKFYLTDISHYCSNKPDLIVPILFTTENTILPTNKSKNSGFAFSTVKRPSFFQEKIPEVSDVDSGQTDNILNFKSDELDSFIQRKNNINFLQDNQVFYFNGKRYNSIDIQIIDNLRIKNTEKKIICAEKTTFRNKKIIFVSLTDFSTKNFQIFKFSSGISFIQIMDISLATFYTLKFEYGYVCKIHICSSDSLQLICLFKDGKIRSFFLEGNLSNPTVLNLKEYPGKNYTNIAFHNSNTSHAKLLFATDGFKLYTFHDSTLLHTSQVFSYPITLIHFNLDKLICTDTNGTIYTSNVDYTQTKPLFSQFGTTYVAPHIPNHLLISDTFSNITKILDMTRPINKIRIISYNSTSVSITDNTVLYIGTYTGSVILPQFTTKKNICSYNIITCHSFENTLFFFTNSHTDMYNFSIKKQIPPRDICTPKNTNILYTSHNQNDIKYLDNTNRYDSKYTKDNTDIKKNIKDTRNIDRLDNTNIERNIKATNNKYKSDIVYNAYTNNNTNSSIHRKNSIGLDCIDNLDISSNNQSDLNLNSKNEFDFTVDINKNTKDDKELQISDYSNSVISLHITSKYLIIFYSNGYIICMEKMFL